MRTLTELGQLAGHMAKLWVQCFWVIATWFTLGAALHSGLIMASAAVGPRPIPATALFIVAVLVKVASMVLMIHAIAPRLTTARAVEGGQLRLGRRVPEQMFRSERPAEVLTVALAPFLVVYTGWGLVEQEVTALFTRNMIRYGFLDAESRTSWSIQLDWWQFYLVVAMIAWLLQHVIDLVVERWPPRPRRLGLLIMVVAEAVWTFCSFLALITLAPRLWEWLFSRRLWVAGTQAWYGIIDALAWIRLPFGLDLPEVLTAAGHWVVVDLLPTLGDAILLPLMWLALTAVVFGWRRFSGRALLHGVRRPEAGGRGLRPVLAAARIGSAELRDKYVPVLTALQMVLRAGPRFLGVYLVLSTALTALTAWTWIGLDHLIGPGDERLLIIAEPITSYGVGLGSTTLAVCLYAAALDQVLGAAAHPVPDTAITEDPATTGS
ncbi:hypothetical protein ACQCX2_12870 [Propionibacteriaceae bacterium Y1700]|uniref:hypothetical protein n=1 Tax=Microlunatus sp. Y1700 TaxID=3418487 RepID=UPI003DA6CED5